MRGTQEGVRAMPDNHHLIRHDGAYYYRRVPERAVKIIGRKRLLKNREWARSSTAST